MGGSQGAEVLEGKVAVVTGASRGYGFATAKLFMAAGARVALLARSAAPLEEAARELGPGCLALATDIGDADSVRRAFRGVGEEFGGLDVLVNNAACGRVGKVEHASDEDLRAMLETNLLGAIYCAREAIPLMRATGGGHIVNVSSDSARHPFPYLCVYAATKGGLEVFSTALRDEVQADGIGVTLLRPGASRVVGEGGLRASTFGAGWDPEIAAEAAALWERLGYDHFSAGRSGGMEPESVAASILHTVTRPDHANIDVLEIRAS
ncbi:MAG: SDR family oxidoreductase [Deltaproteobacteria bacterium]|nr:SDR family oxidoreductase [Deltaproteobacteria bacterium]MBW2362701.1 SDR family oxidoreductase [Deltaproteobacteria bacterium]